MRIMPKTGAFEAIVLGLSEQSHRHQAAIAKFADCALTEMELDPILLEACSLCTEVLDVPAARVLAFRDESGLAPRCAVRRNEHDAEQDYLTDADAAEGAAALSRLCVMPGTMQPRVLSSVSAVIHDGVERFGLLEIDRAYAREFSELETDFISSIARLLGRAVARSREAEAMRLANEALAIQADEARTLLRELSHRVRNDLQMLGGQVYLEQRASMDAASKSGFAALGRRITSLASLYDHLLSSAEQRLVAFDEYLSLLCVRIQDAQDLAEAGIVLEVSARPVRLSLDRAVGLGIVTNELIANAVEHAFQGRDTGRIRLTLNPEGSPGSRASLTIADNGTGAEGPEGNGLHLARRLVALYDGKLVREAGPGTVWRLSFPCI